MDEGYQASSEVNSALGRFASERGQVYELIYNFTATRSRLRIINFVMPIRPTIDHYCSVQVPCLTVNAL